MNMTGAQRFLVTSLALLVACTGSTAEVRLSKQFGLPAVVAASEVERALLTRIPVGTPETSIYEFLDRSRIGKDRHSWYLRANADHIISCRIMGDELVETTYGIFIHIDNERRLDSIEVKKWLTGW